MDVKPYIVTARGKTYVYAWRGGPRVKLLPDHPGFKEAAEAAVKDWNACSGKRKKVLPYAAEKSVSGLIKAAVGNARQRARTRKLPFDISEDDIARIVAANDGCCEVSGIAFIADYDPHGEFAYNPYGVSIDRIKAKDGYILGNIRVVLTAVNFAINQWGIDTFLQIATEVGKRNLQRQYQAHRKRYPIRPGLS